MITLGYRLSDEWNRGTSQIDLRTTSHEELLYSCFLGDIEFKIDDADFSAPWGWVPVVTFALWLWRGVDMTIKTRKGRVRFTESDAEITLSGAGQGLIHVSATYSEDKATVQQAELLEAAKDFLETIVADMKRAYPDLKENIFVESLLLETHASVSSDSPSA